MKQLLMMAVCLTFVYTPVHAQERETNSLTPAKIRAFITDVTQKTKPGGRLPDAEVANYLSAHLADEGIYSSNIVFQVPGFPDQVRELTISKPEFISNVMQGRQFIKNYESNVSVGNITINKEKTEATINTVTREKGRMPVEGNKVLPFDGESSCTQHLKLENSLIVITSAACQTRTTIRER